jgi:predicted nucleotidyltransferase
VRERIIFETVHGSRAYGLETPTSDTDLKGIFVPALSALHGFLPAPEQIEVSSERVLYDYRKFFRLAAACNPTVIELLFTDVSIHRTVTAAGTCLLARRHEFLSRRAGDSFGRYGLSQLRRIKTHRRWLLNPPKEKPTRATYGLPDQPTVTRDQLGAAEAMMADGRMTAASASPNFIEMLDHERRFRQAMKEWQQFQTWQEERNPARAELERKHGYDTKHAMHLIRLLRMAVEILETGKVLVRRPDADELKAVRNGAWSFDQLLEHAERLGGDIERLADSSGLPEHPNEERLNDLCAEIADQALSEDPP